MLYVNYILIKLWGKFCPLKTTSLLIVYSLPEYSAETGGCSLACREMSCPRVDPTPQGILFASFAPWPGVCWLLFLPCTWGCFRLLFHEILGQKNLPHSRLASLGSLPFQSWKRTRRQHQVQPLPFRNKDPEVQRSEATGPHQPGKL